jgi:hypothetical protein
MGTDAGFNPRMFGDFADTEPILRLKRHQTFKKVSERGRKKALGSIA